MGPLVSICIPNYNQGKFIADAIMSAYMQTYDNIEVVIVDNASTDNSREVINNITNIRKNITRVVYLSSNRGMAASHKECIVHAKGDYIKFLHADDILLTNCVEQMVYYMRFDYTKLVACARIYTDVNLNPQRLLQWYKHDRWIYGETTIDHCTFYGNMIGEPTAVMFRKKDIGMLSNRYPYLLDLTWWFDLLDSGGYLAYIAEPLVLYRRHNQLDSYAKCIGEMTSDNITLAHEYMKKPYVKVTFLRLFELYKRYVVDNIYFRLRRLLCLSSL
jgi:glycosyltransferase involved in cell wall biosynthesis